MKRIPVPSIAWLRRLMQRPEALSDGPVARIASVASADHTPAGASLRRAPVLLGLAATLTACALSVAASWQRGGWFTERLLWVALGVVLVVACHVLPAICRYASRGQRLLASAVWSVAALGVVYGHAGFVLLAQQHAGESRAAQVSVPVADGAAGAGPDLVAAARDRARLVGQLAASGTSRRAALLARLDALDVRMAEDRRSEARADRATGRQDQALERREAARDDPVTGRLATLTGLPASRIDLAVALLLAAALEGVAIVCWMIAASPAASRESLSGLAGPASHVPRPGVASPGHAGVEPVTQAPEATADPELGRLHEAIGTGAVRPTVTGIRRYLACSQSRAIALRRQLMKEVP